MTTDEDAVRELFTTMYAAWAAGDADGFVAAYREDATVVLPGVYHRGREAVRGYMAAGFAGPLRGSRALDEPEEIRFLGGDTAIVVSRAAVLMPGERAVPPERERVATWVLAKEGREWTVAAYANAPR